jgi:hypothetical protein
LPTLPPPTATTLREQLRLSLGSDDAFLWRQRLLTERLMRNITALQEHVLLYVRGLIDQGIVQFSHAEVAQGFAGAKIGTVKDALRRAKGLGLLDWREEYRPGPGGVRRRVANTYQALMPQQSPVPRPDLRRRPALVSKRPSLSISKPTCSLQCGEPDGRPLPGFEARFAAKLAEEKLLRLARLGRRPP